MDKSLIEEYGIFPRTSDGTLTTEYGYDAVGNLVRQANENVTLTYRYDLNNRMTEEARTEGGTTLRSGFAYDKAGQLTSFRRSDGYAEAYTYDPVGNAEDIEVIEQTDENAQPEIDLSFTEKVSMGVKASSEKLAKGVKAGVKSAGAGLANAFSKVKSSAASKKKTDIDKTLETIEKLAQMRDAGILTEEEFNYIKKELLGM